MSFETEILNPVTDKIVLVEIDVPIENTYWINYEAGIWYINLMPGDTTVTGSDGLVGYYAGQNSVKYNIQSLKVGTEFYTKVTSIANLRSTDKSFLFDYGIQTLYVHFEDFHYPQGYTVKMGNVIGFCDKADSELGCYYNDVEYQPRVKSVPNLSKKKDPLFFGVLEFQGGTIDFNNDDGGMDDLTQMDIFGQPLRVLLGFAGFAYSDFEKIFSGYVEEPSHDFNSYQISIRDPRKKLSRKIPVNRFNYDDYPDLGEDDFDKPIPIAFGVIRGAPVVCTNSEDGAGPYVYKFMDTTDYSAQSIQEVYVDGVPVTPTGSDLNAGTITLTAGQVKDGDSFLDVTMDFTGASLDNGLDVITYLNEEFGDTAYISTVYDTTEWAYEQSIADDIGLYIYERREIIEIIGDICKSLHGIFYPKDDGRFSFRSYRSDRLVTKTIYPDEWTDDPDISYPSDEYLTSANVKYAEDIANSEYREYINDTYEDEVWGRHGVYKEEEFPTLLTNESDAQALSEKIMIRSKEIEQEVKRRTSLMNFTLEIMDFIIAEHNRPEGYDTFYDREWGIYEITGINKMAIKGEVDLTMRKVEDYDWTEITYMQGYLHLMQLFGWRPFGPTTYYRG